MDMKTFDTRTQQYYFILSLHKNKLHFIEKQELITIGDYYPSWVSTLLFLMIKIVNIQYSKYF